MDKLETTQLLLLFTPHKTFWEICIYHEWILGFDPNNLMGLKNTNMDKVETITNKVT
jgi:hypothetical protein